MVAFLTRLGFRIGSDLNLLGRLLGFQLVGFRLGHILVLEGISFLLAYIVIGLRGNEVAFLVRFGAGLGLDVQHAARPFGAHVRLHVQSLLVLGGHFLFLGLQTGLALGHAKRGGDDGRFLLLRR